jgi:carbonic anhydrase
MRVRAAADCTEVKIQPLAVAALLVAASVSLAAGPGEPDAPRALARLKAGNGRFVADPAAALPIGERRREALLAGQDPFAVVLSCADARVPPEVIFNTGLGDLFVVRAAGEVLDRAVVASLEYGAERLHTPLLVVMGHEFCDTVRAAIDAAPGARSSGPNLDFLIKAIQPAVARTAGTLFEEPLKAAVLANVEQIVTDLQAQSDIVRRLVETGELQIVGAYYELSSGQVTFSQPVGAGRPVVTRVTRASTPTAPSAPTVPTANRALMQIQELQKWQAASESAATPAASAAAPPAPEKPAPERPAAEKPAAEKPAAGKPAAEKPPDEKPAAAKPATPKPTATAARPATATAAPAPAAKPPAGHDAEPAPPKPKPH